MTARMKAIARDDERAAGDPRHNEAAGGGMTLIEVGKAMGIGRERVRQIEKRALLKLAQALHDRGYTADDLFD